MTINLSKPFASYVAEQELPKTGDARRFAIHLVFEVEGTKRTEQIRWEWRYSGTQEAIDQKSGVDGLAARRKRELEAFFSHIENELKKSHERLYADGDRPMLVKGKNTG